MTRHRQSKGAGPTAASSASASTSGSGQKVEAGGKFDPTTPVALPPLPASLWEVMALAESIEAERVMPARQPLPRRPVPAAPTPEVVIDAGQGKRGIDPTSGEVGAGEETAPVINEPKAPHPLPSVSPMSVSGESSGAAGQHMATISVSLHQGSDSPTARAGSGGQHLASIAISLHPGGEVGLGTDGGQHLATISLSLHTDAPVAAANYQAVHLPLNPPPRPEPGSQAPQHQQAPVVEPPPLALPAAPLFDDSDDRTVAVCWFRGQSVPKPHNDSFGEETRLVWRQNEDRYRLVETPEGILAAVADGAGGSGLYCGAWAEALLEHLPAEPIGEVDGLNAWIGAFWKEFRDDIKMRAASSPAMNSKFVREGSCATLTTAWLTKRDEGMALHWLGYGDSPLLVFDRTGPVPLLIHCHPSTLVELDRDPNLLNWKNLPQAACLRTGAMDLPRRATVVLASDGMGWFVTLRYLAELAGHHAAIVAPDGLCATLLQEFHRLVESGKGRLAKVARSQLENPGTGSAAFLDVLRAALETEETFSTLVKERNELGNLPNDDSTLIIVDIEPCMAPACMPTETP